MNKIWSFTITTMILGAVFATTINTPLSHAAPALPYSFDYTRINEGGLFSTSAGNYDLIDEVRAVGITGETQASTNFTITDVTFEKIIANTPSKTKNWENYE